MWRTYMIPDKPAPRGKSAMGVALYGPAGAPIWSAPTIDIRRGLIYVATGNSYAGAAAPSSDAVVALTLSGKIAWVKQLFPKDVFISGCRVPSANPNCADQSGPDYDFGNSPILARLPHGREAIVIGQKSGMGWALDPSKRGENHLAVSRWRRRRARRHRMGFGSRCRTGLLCGIRYLCARTRRAARRQPADRTTGVVLAAAAAQLHCRAALQRGAGSGHQCDSRDRIFRRKRWNAACLLKPERCNSVAVQHGSRISNCKWCPGTGSLHAGSGANDCGWDGLCDFRSRRVRWSPGKCTARLRPMSPYARLHVSRFVTA
jgi:hypothetical protein